MSSQFTSEAQKQCAILALAALVTFMALSLMGAAQPPQSQPVPPSPVNYTNSAGY